MIASTAPDVTTSSPDGVRVGIGLRWEHLEDVLAALASSGRVEGVDHLEICPENYARRGGYIPEALETVRAKVPVLCHGLTLDVGGLAPLDAAFIGELRAFLRHVQAPFFSEHLCVSGFDGGTTHDLLPLPLTRGAVRHVVARVREVQDRLELPFALENVSHYLQVGRADMPEADFITEILDRTGAGLLLDVNNVVVNARNHGFDPHDFVGRLPLERVVQIHVAGHAWSEEHGVIIDTHGAGVIDPVLDVLEHAVARTGPVPVVLERDHHLPSLAALVAEASTLRDAVGRGLARRAGSSSGVAASPRSAR